MGDVPLSETGSDRCSSSFFCSHWQSCRSDLQSGWFHKTSHLVEVPCRAPQLGRQISILRPCQLTYLSTFSAGLKDVVWGLVSLSALTHESVWNANPLQIGIQTTRPCAQTEDSGLLSLLHSPNWAKVCQVSSIICVQPDQHWYYFEGNLGWTAERQGRVCMGLSKCDNAFLRENQKHMKRWSAHYI